MGILVDNSTTALLSMALDAAAMRQQAIAQNIANANTPGYRSHSVSFEEHFSDVRDSLEQGRSVSTSGLAAYRPVLDIAEATEPVGSSSLDMEVAKLSENALHHQALLKALNRHISIISAAIGEGKH